jgi:5-methylcytosine-specific restriction endonuclease McrA
MADTWFVQPCDICGETFRSKSRRDICDDCIPEARRSGPVGYDGYEGQYTGYYGPNWEEVRTEVLERDGYECQSCGLSEERHRELEMVGGGLHVHHIVPAKQFDSYEAANDLDNLVTLCAECHRGTKHGEEGLDSET